jgi:tripartite-type tricarboxylate transporter receptor subunit TctC
VTTWYGVFAPRGTPPDIVAKLNKTINDILAETEVKTRLDSVGVLVKGSTAPEFGAFMQNEFKRWDAVREAAHIERQ